MLRAGILRITRLLAHSLPSSCVPHRTPHQPPLCARHDAAIWVDQSRQTWFHVQRVLSYSWWERPVNERSRDGARGQCLQLQPGSLHTASAHFFSLPISGPVRYEAANTGTWAGPGSCQQWWSNETFGNLCLHLNDHIKNLPNSLQVQGWL